MTDNSNQDHTSLPQPTQVLDNYPVITMPQTRSTQPGAQGVLPQPATYAQSPQQPADAPTIAQLERLVKKQTPLDQSHQDQGQANQPANTSSANDQQTDRAHEDNSAQAQPKDDASTPDGKPEKSSDSSSTPVAELAASDDVPHEVQEINRQLQEARDKQSTAKDQAAEAIQEVKQAEQQAIQAHEQLQEQLKQAKQKVEQANRAVSTAEQKHQESEQQFQQVQQSQGGANSVTVAGYRPTDLLEALVKPPQPAPTAQTGPTLDKTTRQQVAQEVGQTGQEVKQTKQHVQQASTYIESAQQQAQKAHKQEKGIVQKLSQLLASLDSNPSGQKKRFNAFIVVGAVLVLVSFILLAFQLPVFFSIVLIAAFVQLGIGFVALKQRPS